MGSPVRIRLPPQTKGRQTKVWWFFCIHLCRACSSTNVYGKSKRALAPDGLLFQCPRGERSSDAAKRNPTSRIESATYVTPSPHPFPRGRGSAAEAAVFAAGIVNPRNVPGLLECPGPGTENGHLLRTMSQVDKGSADLRQKHPGPATEKGRTDYAVEQVYLKMSQVCWNARDRGRKTAIYCVRWRR